MAVLPSAAAALRGMRVARTLPCLKVMLSDASATLAEAMGGSPSALSFAMLSASGAPERLEWPSQARDIARDLFMPGHAFLAAGDAESAGTERAAVRGSTHRRLLECAGGPP